MKQTAVEFLVKKLKSQGLLIGETDNLIAVREAKEMENKNLNDRINAIYEVILQLHNNEEITGFSKRAYAQCLDIVEQFKNK